ncbi:MAG TPA: ABC transporter permease [Puia sp.]
MHFKSYFKAAWRSLTSHKWYSAINIMGLATGTAVALLIGLWIWDELSFDQYHAHYGRLAQVMDVQTIQGEASTDEAIAIPLSNALRNQYGNDFRRIALVYPNFTHTVAVGDKKIPASGIWAEPDLPEMLTLKMKKGRRDALKDPTSVLITQSLAKTLFGNEDPMNKVVRLDNMATVKVAGVYEDLPQNTRFYGTKLILAWDKALTVMPWLKDYQTKWDTRYWWLFVEMNEGVPIDKVSARIKDIIKSLVKGNNEAILLHPMSQWHLYNEFKNGQVAGGRIRLVRLFGIIGAFVLLLACINFMNLSTARSARRAKEVGIRKTIGSLRRQLIGQFLSESLLVALLAFILAIGMAQLSLPFFNHLTEKQISIPYGAPMFWVLMVGFIVFTGVVSRSYPALYLSGFRPVEVLKGSFIAGRSAALPRKILIVVQFSVSVILIIGAVVVYRQIQHARDRPVGYTREGLITVTMSTMDIYGAPYNTLRNALLETGAVSDMAKSSFRATEAPGNDTGFDWKGKDPNLVPMMGVFGVTHDFGNTIGWHIQEGRDFSRSYPTDTGSVIINEAAVKLTGLRHPLGETIRFYGKSHIIVGVVRDMVMGSPYKPVQPTIFWLEYGSNNAMTVRLKPGIPLREALAKTEGVFKRFDPGGAFQYQFADEEYAKKFVNEERIGSLALLSAILAIFISCLGLFGLASFTAEQRTKEIGIRKVLGASVVNLWGLLLKEFVRLVILSLLIATPVVYYLMHNWLQQYEYRTALSWWIFALAGAGTLILTLLTVSYQSIKAALMDPVKSLKME